MPSLDDLKKRIKRVKATQKITKAMKMVAAAKLRKAQENAEKGRPYSQKMQNIILNLTNSIKFSNSEAFGDSGKFYSKLKSIFKYLRLISLILIVTALSRPQVIDTSTRVKTNSGIDIIMAIDVSASMLAKDLKPNTRGLCLNNGYKFILLYACIFLL